MRQAFNLLVLSVTLSLISQSVYAQGAVQAVRGAVDGIKQKVDDSQAPLTAGPADKLEKVAPGKIDEGASKQFTKLNSGLQYRVLRKGTGKKPIATDTVVAHYKGWLDNKQIFDSSYRRGQPIPFPLNRVIPGWTEGMQYIGKGGMIELRIPYALGYGERGTPGGPVPPRANLHFVVELIDIK